MTAPFRRPDRASTFARFVERFCAAPAPTRRVTRPEARPRFPRIHLVILVTSPAHPARDRVPRRSRTGYLLPASPPPHAATGACARAPLPGTALVPALDAHATAHDAVPTGTARRKPAAVPPVSPPAGTTSGIPYNASEPSLASTSRAHSPTAATGSRSRRPPTPQPLQHWITSPPPPGSPSGRR